VTRGGRTQKNRVNIKADKKNCGGVKIAPTEKADTTQNKRKELVLFMLSVMGEIGTNKAQ